MSIIEQINEGIKEAMRSRDQVRLATLRMLKSKVMAVDARANLPDTEVIKLFKTYFGSLQEALVQAQEASRPDIAEQLKSELVIIQEFLPKALSLEETKKIVLEAIAESGAKTKKELGLVMKHVMKLNSAVDGKLARDVASELLMD
ncbi:MAG: GatB/YqeY domain-containing protein [Simkaniaceae bacterium]|nr:GatB/YqeY domain-containing protein [Simkaniaceae bacterium]